MVAIPVHGRFARADMILTDKIFWAFNNIFDGMNRDSVSSVKKVQNVVRLSYGLCIAVVIN